MSDQEITEGVWLIESSGDYNVFYVSKDGFVKNFSGGVGTVELSIEIGINFLRKLDLEELAKGGKK